MTPVPDLRRLLLAVRTPFGIYAPGLVVEVVEQATTGRRLRVCLDGPGLHLGPCRRVWLPLRALTSRENMPDYLHDLRPFAWAWDPAAA